MVFEYILLQTKVVRRSLPWLFLVGALAGNYLNLAVLQIIVSLAVGAILNVVLYFCSSICTAVIATGPIMLLYDRESKDADDRAFYLLFWAQQIFILIGFYHLVFKHMNFQLWQTRITYAASLISYIRFLILSSSVDKESAFKRSVLSGIALVINAVFAVVSLILFCELIRDPETGLQSVFSTSESPTSKFDLYGSYNVFSVYLLIIAAYQGFTNYLVDVLISRDKNRTLALAEQLKNAA